MTALLEKIEQEARLLTRHEREQLAADLVAGLDETPLSENEHAWIEESEKRYESWRAGRTQGVPVDQVLDELRHALRR